MLSRLHSFLFFATTLIVTLQSQSSIAVQISNPDGSPKIKFFEPSETRPGGVVKLQAWPFYDPRSYLYFGKVIEIRPGAILLG